MASVLSLQDERGLNSVLGSVNDRKPYKGKGLSSSLSNATQTPHDVL